MDNPLLCPACQFKIHGDWFFCPNCAKELKEKISVISVPKQILIYFVSFFLSPLGLGWGLKYIRSRDNKVRKIGVISIVLTILSMALMIGIFRNFINQYTKTLNDIVPSY